jgi:hypothetical protein
MAKMADPHALYVITAIVVLGLIAWVAVVLSRPGSAHQQPSPQQPSPSQPPNRAEVEHGDQQS